MKGGATISLSLSFVADDKRGQLEETAMDWLIEMALLAAVAIVVTELVGILVLEMVKHHRHHRSRSS